jgi:hypothetical protein
VTAGPPRIVWVEVATELLAELGEWSDPVRVRISDLRPDGGVEMVFQKFDAAHQLDRTVPLVPPGDDHDLPPTRPRRKMR